jgi:hypothetical protein
MENIMDASSPIPTLLVNFTFPTSRKKFNPSTFPHLPGFKFNLKCFELVLVSHTCNPSYSGGRYQEDYGLKPALGK